MPIRGLRNLSYYWYKNRMDEQDRVDAYWDGDTQDLYHQQQLEEQEMATAKYEQKPGTIAVFKADKEGNDKRPDWTGNMMMSKRRGTTGIPVDQRIPEGIDLPQR